MPSPFINFMFIGAILGGSMTVAMTIFYNMIVKRSWPVEVPIAVQRGNSVVWKLGERAKAVKTKSGHEVLKLRKAKDVIKPPKFGRVSVNTNGKPVYMLFNTARGQYFPIKLMSPPKLEVVEDKSSKNWAINELGRLSKVYAPKESALLRFAPYIMNATFAAMVIFFIIYFGGKMELIANSLGGAANSLTNAVNILNMPPP
jgi:hypothetical protein